MSPARAQRPQVWLESLGDWTWPGQQRAMAVAEVLPPPWVPTLPPQEAASAQAPPLPAVWLRWRRILIALLLVALAAVSAALLLRDAGGHARRVPAGARVAADSPEGRLLPAPPLVTVHTASTGSSIMKAHFNSIALHRPAGYYVYLPPGHLSAAAGTRYPVLYLLHGNSQKATAFLEMGIEQELDRLTAGHAMPPVIAVMIQGGPGANNWRNLNGLNYESYVLEVQEIVDHTLPTLATRNARAIAGLSMGGYGAMALALNNPDRFGVVESWLGFFNGLEGQLQLDRHTIKALGLHAFLYGGASDKIANPAEDAPFAAELRAAGADATSAIYPGEHNVATVEAHLEHMLRFAGGHLQAAAAHAAS